jgi:hypothetical protein
MMSMAPEFRRSLVSWTPLMWAALECRAEIVKVLLDRGADVSLRANSDRKDSSLDSGQTAILVASGCFTAHRRADLAPERHMPGKLCFLRVGG